MEFPFGEKLYSVQNAYNSAKDIFVLGDIPGAVHAKWVFGRKTICNALAVASETCIFWDGNPYEADDIIGRINIPKELGLLVLPGRKSNGLAGRVLDNNILKPLGLKRSDVYMSYVIPEYRLSKSQQKMINEVYNPLRETFGLNEVTIPEQHELICDDKRIEKITEEILLSKAGKLILLGDIPIKQYLKYVCDIGFSDLNDYIKKYGYGSPYKGIIKEKEIDVIPLAQPDKITGFLPHTEWEKKIWEY